MIRFEGHLGAGLADGLGGEGADGGARLDGRLPHATADVLEELQQRLNRKISKYTSN